jgi:hypothetical protein
VWSNHSGTLGQVDVLSGAVSLNQTETEDVNALLAGGPYNGPTLYASFVVNLSALPLSGAGTYFAHFKDDGAQNFKCRVFATVNGAATGTFRVGVANGGNTPAVIARDLELGSNYLLVVRYETGTAVATLWIEPSSEGSTADRADGSDSTSVVGITTFALRQSNASGGMGVLAFDDLKVGTAFSDVVEGGDPTRNPPGISNIPDQRIPASSSTPPVAFVVTDGETAPGSLTLSATSSDEALVPVANVVFAGSDSNRTVTVIPAAGRQGASRITVTVTDGDANTASRDFLVIVGAPSLSAIANQTTPKDTATPPIPFTVSDPENDVLTLSAASSDEGLVLAGGITFDGAGTNRTVTVTPVPGVSGLVRITLFATDGFNTTSNSFLLTIYPSRGVDLADTFGYENGSVVTNSSFFWNTHSGTAGQTQVEGGELRLSGSQSEDVSAFLTNSPYLPAQGWILYCRFNARFLGLPTAGNGEYFAHFRNTGISFGARVFATTNGAAAGKLRLGIANNTTAPSAVLPTDLATDVSHAVVARLNVATAQSTLWVNPTSESDLSVTATDNAIPFEVWTYAFRQANAIGTIAIDEVKIGTAFSDVVTAGHRLRITLTGPGSVRIAWPKAASDAGYALQSAMSLPGGWSNYPNQGSSAGDDLVVDLNNVSGKEFFRLAR